MKTAVVTALALALALAGSVYASDPVGIYALIDKVVLEPNKEAPKRIQIWGAFAVAQGRGDDYTPPARGYMYFSMPQGQEEQCRREWADLSKIAGTGQCVAFGTRYGAKGTVRRPRQRQEPVGEVQPEHIAKLIADLDSKQFQVRDKATKELEKLGEAAQPALRMALKEQSSPEVRQRLQRLLARDTPDVYPVASGLYRLRSNDDYPPIRALFQLPAPLSPADGDVVEPGKLTLTVRNILDKRRQNAKYVFELASASGDKETSPEIKAGNKETKWSPRMEVKPGHKYAWRAWATEEGWTGPAATSAFQAKAGR